jgi:hypothetical protein
MNENSTIFAFNISEDGLGTPPRRNPREKPREKSVDGDGPVQARLQIPTGLVAEMREERVDAG